MPLLKYTIDYSMIDWNYVLDNLGQGKDITPDPNIWNLSNPSYMEIYDLWKTSKFNMQSIKWTNYYPGAFPKEVDEYYCKTLSLNYLRSWISRIDPGFYAPWHWDVDDRLDDYLALGTPIRYSIFISPPSITSVFVVGNKCYSNMPQGSVIEWKEYNDWHAGMNAGLEPKFIYHFLGY